MGTGIADAPWSRHQRKASYLDEAQCKSRRGRGFSAISTLVARLMRGYCGHFLSMAKGLLKFGTAMAVSAGLGMAGLGLASGTAQAEPGPVPLYHWCPGDFWDPGWGDNWEGGACHDDFHRDMDGWDHSRDWRPDQGPGWQGGDRGGDNRQWQPGGDPGRDHGGQPWWPGH